jgi:hypothetical protein
MYNHRQSRDLFRDTGIKILNPLIPGLEISLVIGFPTFTRGKHNMYPHKPDSIDLL